MNNKRREHQADANAAAKEQELTELKEQLTKTKEDLLKEKRWHGDTKAALRKWERMTAEELGEMIAGM